MPVILTPISPHFSHLPSPTPIFPPCLPPSLPPSLPPFLPPSLPPSFRGEAGAQYLVWNQEKLHAFLEGGREEGREGGEEGDVHSYLSGQGREGGREEGREGGRG